MPSETPRRVSRRSVSRGVAWVTPAVAAAAAAPAYAVSAQCGRGCPSMLFGGALSANGWALTSTGNYAQGANQRVGFSTSFSPWNGTDGCTGVTGGSGGGTLTGSTTGDGVLIAEADPTSATPTPTLVYGKSICLTGGVTYTFTYGWSAYRINRRTQYLQARLRSETGVITAIGAQVEATAGSVHASGTRTGTFAMPPGPSQWYTFEYVWTFNTTTPAGYSDCDANANDIAVNSPRVTCSPVP